MKNKDEMLFTAGQFAALHGINKRTLLYYDDIGLFTPAVKKENGYRYYTYMQSPALEMILTFRELDMSIEDIKAYIGERSPDALTVLLHNKRSEIDETIKKLRSIRRMLGEKEALLELQKEIDLNKIELVECKAEYLVLSDSITDSCDEEYLADLVEHAKRFHTHHLFNHTYGTMIAVSGLYRGEFENYDYFFTKVDTNQKKKGLVLKPEGRYLRAFCKGSWDKLPDTYRRILAFAQTHQYKLTGYAYEEGINELVIQDIEDYVTQIMIPVE